MENSCFDIRERKIHEFLPEGKDNRIFEVVNLDTGAPVCEGIESRNMARLISNLLNKHFSKKVKS